MSGNSQVGVQEKTSDLLTATTDLLVYAEAVSKEDALHNEANILRLLGIVMCQQEMILRLITACSKLDLPDEHKQDLEEAFLIFRQSSTATAATLTRLMEANENEHPED